jgi:hypothetical protein
MIEKSSIVLTSWGQKSIDDAYPIVMPIDWHLNQTDTFPYFAGEMITHWQLPSARPLPDYDTFMGVPAERIDLNVSVDEEVSQLIGAT